MRLPARALAVSVDPDARIFRRLDPQEIAPTLRQVMLDEATRVAAPADPEMRAIALELAQAILEHEVHFFDPAVTDKRTPLVVIGLHAQMTALLEQHGLPPAPPELPNPGGGAYAYAGRTHDGRNFAVVSAADAASLAALARPLPHLGAQSYALFEGTRSVARGVWAHRAPRVAVQNP